MQKIKLFCKNRVELITVAPPNRKNLITKRRNSGDAIPSHSLNKSFQ